MLKLGLRDLDANFTPLETNYPESAFVETAARQNNAAQVLARSDAEDGTGRLYVFNLDDVLLASLREIIERERITVVFNRKTGQSDVRLPIDLTVTDIGADLKPIRSHSELGDFAACTSELLPAMGERLGLE